MYVAVKGGETAIAHSLDLLADKRRGDRGVAEVSLDQIDQQLGLAVDRVMTEGSCYDRALAALAIKQAALAKVEGDRIVIRDPIRFVFAKDEVLPESLPILADVARVLADNPRILYVVVEGHASEEGSFEYNYALSTARARAIYRVLIEVGVHPDRLGYRAMGEVAPENLGTDEVGLAANRRVLFRIERQLTSDMPPPSWEPVPVPWTGRLPRSR